MGFSNYREFQHYLHELSVSQATSLDTLQTSKTKGSSLSARVREAVDRDLHNLQRFRNGLDAERIAALAKKIRGMRRIIILGGDLAASLACFLHSLSFDPARLARDDRDIHRGCAALDAVRW